VFIFLFWTAAALVRPRRILAVSPACRQGRPPGKGRAERADTPVCAPRKRHQGPGGRPPDTGTTVRNRSCASVTRVKRLRREQDRHGSQAPVEVADRGRLFDEPESVGAFDGGTRPRPRASGFRAQRLAAGLRPRRAPRPESGEPGRCFSMVGRVHRSPPASVTSPRLHVGLSRQAWPSVADPPISPAASFPRPRRHQAEPRCQGPTDLMVSLGRPRGRSGLSDLRDLGNFPAVSPSPATTGSPRFGDPGDLGRWFAGRIAGQPGAGRAGGSPHGGAGRAVRRGMGQPRARFPRTSTTDGPWPGLGRSQSSRGWGRAETR